MQEDGTIVSQSEESHSHHRSPVAYFTASNSSTSDIRSPAGSYFWQGPITPASHPSTAHISHSQPPPPHHGQYWPVPSPYPTPNPPSQATSPYPHHSSTMPPMSYNHAVIHVDSSHGEPPSYHVTQPHRPDQHQEYPRTASPAVPEYVQLPTLPPLNPVVNVDRSGHPVADLLQSLDLVEYLDVLLHNGFDTLSALSDIQEDDFEYLGIKRGHRRLLRRELASMRGVPKDTPLTLVGQEVTTGLNDDEATDASHFHPHTVSQVNRNTFYLSAPSPRSRAASVSSTGAGEPAKRRYRRHPKVDPHAPVKPASAYVEFSNVIREEMKGASFTEIARRVGERWQALSKQEKERLENKAAAEKEAYFQAFAAYKDTPEYAEYQQYLIEFKKKYPSALLPEGGSAAANAATAAASLPTPSSASTTPNPFASYHADRSAARQDLGSSNTRYPEDGSEPAEGLRSSKRLRSASNFTGPAGSSGDTLNSNDEDASAATAAAMVLAGTGPWMQTQTQTNPSPRLNVSAVAADKSSALVTPVMTVGEALQCVDADRRRSNSVSEGKWPEV